MGRREPWPADLKAQARSLYERDGLSLAVSVTGVPERTVQHWSKTEQWTRPGSDRNGRNRAELRLAPAPHAAQGAGKPVQGQVVALGYGYQRRALLRRLGDLAGKALDRAEVELEAGHTIKARDATVVVGIALDKAELLARAAGPDQAGGYPEMAEVVGRLRELAADLKARRTGTDGQPD